MRGERSNITNMELHNFCYVHSRRNTRVEKDPFGRGLSDPDLLRFTLKATGRAKENLLEMQSQIQHPPPKFADSFPDLHIRFLRSASTQCAFCVGT